MRSVYVRLRDEELRRLVELSRQERRRPGDQAAILLAESLRRGTPQMDQRAADAEAVRRPSDTSD